MKNSAGCALNLKETFKEARSYYLQNTASELLTPQEIFELNGGALGLIPDDMIDDLIGDFSEPVRAALEAEARIRRALSSAESSYEELEEIAVFHGDPPEEYNERDIPEGRWLLHPLLPDRIQAHTGGDLDTRG